MDYQNTFNGYREAIRSLALLEEHGALTPVVEATYETVNGSFVRIIDRDHTNSGPSAFERMSQYLGAEPYEKRTGITFYTALILDGGHGNPEYRGETVGSVYALTSEGVYLAGVAHVHPVCLGLSLLYEVSVSYDRKDRPKSTIPGVHVDELPKHNPEDTEHE